jgi:small subunit ribosomal protein S17
MAKVITGKVVSTKMQDTIVVEVTRFVPHPLYKKLLKRSKKFKVATNGFEVTVGRRVKIAETKPMAKDKHFKVLEVIAEQHEKTVAKAKTEKPVVEATVKAEKPASAKASTGKGGKE